MSDNNITLETMITRNEAISTTMIDGEVGMMSIEKGKYFILDEIGSRIWEIVENSESVKEIINILINEYEVDFDTCKNDVIELLEGMLQDELIKINYNFFK